MRKWQINRKAACLGRRGRRLGAIALAGMLLLSGCAKGKEPEGFPAAGENAGRESAAEIKEEEGTQPKEQEETEASGSGISGESAKDAEVDFAVLQAENPDIFAWLYIPGTDIDRPVLRSQEADDYYENHNAYGEEGEEGALYVELANMRDMCDFNTVIHGKTSSVEEKGLFDDLHRFADRDFFEEHEEVFLYLEDNLLTYTVFAAYERENTSLIRSYDFTYGSGCQQFLDDMYGAREMGKNLREGWEEVTPYHFLITLTTQSSQDPEKQFVVIAALSSDAAGKIDRAVEW